MSEFMKENDEFYDVDPVEIADRQCLKKEGFSEEEIDAAIERSKGGGGDNDDDEETTDEELRKMFSRYATSAGEDDDGYITLRALKAGMQDDGAPLEDDDYDIVFEALDVVDGKIDLPTFIQFYRRVTGQDEQIDPNDDGDDYDDDDC